MRHTTRGAAAAIAAGLALAVATVACSSNGSDPSMPTVPSWPGMPTTTVVEFPAGTAPADTVTFRPVVGTGMEADGAPAIDALGPVAIDGTALEQATASFNEQIDQWTVEPLFTAAGIEAFNSIAKACWQRFPTCPTSQLAILVDGEVISAPTIQSDGFERDAISISGDFDQSEAEDLARTISAAAHGS
jgi:hypothetical protein